jgi:hypothetical protein
LRDQISTPLGPVFLECSFEGWPEGSEQTGSEQTRGTVVRNWVIEDRADIRLIVARISAEQDPDHEPVTDTIGVVWTLRAHVETPPFILGALRSAIAEDEEVGWKTDERFVSTLHETADWTLSIGSQDEEALARRVRPTGGRDAEGVDSLPSAWSAAFSIEIGSLTEEFAVDMGTRGLRARLPPLPAGSTVNLHFAVCWSRPRFGDSDTTWATDTGPEIILRQALGTIG